MIENEDIFLDKNGAFDLPAWKVYRRFLFSVLGYYVTDILWGLFEYLKLPKVLFANTSVYFVAMASGIFFWSTYVVRYLDEKNNFGKILISAGHSFSMIVTILTAVNIFVPVLFTVDPDCVSHALGMRYAILISHIVMLLLVSVYAFSSIEYFRACRYDKRS